MGRAWHHPRRRGRRSLAALLVALLLRGHAGFEVLIVASLAANDDGDRWV
jgi:hypothetical protein